MFHAALLKIHQVAPTGINSPQVELWAASKHLVFQSAGRQLFGRAFFERWGGDYLQRTFFDFEVRRVAHVEYGKAQQS